MSDVKGTGLEGYLTNVKRESVVALDNPPAADPGLATDPALDPLPEQRMTRPDLSRPPSIAASLSSMDDHIAFSPRVSVAAFRKGIRRPSEGPRTMSEIGHGGLADDDEVPVGMLSQGFGGGRARSVASLSSLWNEAEDIPLTRSPPPSPAPNPGLAFTVQRHTRNDEGSGSGGFVVKSARTTRVIHASKDLDRVASGVQNPASFASRHSSRPPSPTLADTQEIINSPAPLTSNDGCFSIRAPNTMPGRPKTPAPFNSVSDPIEACTEVAPLPASPARNPPPPVEPLVLPQAGDKTPASIDLPLPLDQMPGSPPKFQQDLPASPSQIREVTSPTKGRKVSLLDEPMKLLSGLRPGSPPPETESFDTALVVASMRVLSEDGAAPPIPVCGDLPRLPSRATLFDVQAPSSADERLRPSLQTRLTNAASGLSKPALARLVIGEGDSVDGHETERLRSPESESGTASPAVTTAPRFPSSFGLVDRSRTRTTGGMSSARKSRSDWSSSESEDEADKRNRRASTRRAPSGPRKQSMKKPPFPSSQSIPRSEHSMSDMKSSSEDESLSVLRAKASRSSSSLAGMKRSTSGIPPPLPSAIPQVRSPVPFELGSLLPVPSLMSIGASLVRDEASRSAIGSSGSSSSAIEKLPDLSTSRMGQRTTASPASSQSGLTSDSLGQNPSTPRDSFVGLNNRVRENVSVGHSRESSRELDSMPSPPVSLLGIFRESMADNFHRLPYQLRLLQYPKPHLAILHA